MPAYQICVRCEHRWPVTGQPRQWCPGCRGLLLSPVDPQRPVPPARRNFRWVAVPSTGTATSRSVPPGPGNSAGGPTPRYEEVPRWGLRDPRSIPDFDEPTRAEKLAEVAPTLLVATAVLFAAAALAETVRYGLLLFNRTRLVDPVALALSDAAVGSTQVLAPLVALVAVVAAALRLIRVRARMYAARGTSDPRPPALIVLGCAIPLVNLALPGVFLTEIDDGSPRLRRAIRTWWVLWVVSAVLVVVTLLWRQRDTLQARADGVILSALAAAVAAVVAVAALRVLRLFDGADLRGRPLKYRQLTVASGPVHSPIAPIEPAAQRSVPDEPVEAVESSGGSAQRREPTEAVVS